MVNVLKFNFDILTLFLSSSLIKFWLIVIRVELHKILVHGANRQDPDQKQSELGLHSLSRPFWQVTWFQNFRTFKMAEVYKVFNSEI